MASSFGKPPALNKNALFEGEFMWMLHRNILGMDPCCLLLPCLIHVASVLLSCAGTTRKSHQSSADLSPRTPLTCAHASHNLPWCSQHLREHRSKCRRSQKSKRHTVWQVKEVAWNSSSCWSGTDSSSTEKNIWGCLFSSTPGILLDDPAWTRLRSPMILWTACFFLLRIRS